MQSSVVRRRTAITTPKNTITPTNTSEKTSKKSLENEGVLIDAAVSSTIVQPLENITQNEIITLQPCAENATHPFEADKVADEATKILQSNVMSSIEQADLKISKDAHGNFRNARYASLFNKTCLFASVQMPQHGNALIFYCIEIAAIISFCLFCVIKMFSNRIWYLAPFTGLLNVTALFSLMIVFYRRRMVPHSKETQQSPSVWYKRNWLLHPASIIVISFIVSCIANFCGYGGHFSIVENMVSIDLMWLTYYLIKSRNGMLFFHFIKNDMVIAYFIIHKLLVIINLPNVDDCELLILSACIIIHGLQYIVNLNRIKRNFLYNLIGKNHLETASIKCGEKNIELKRVTNVLCDKKNVTHILEWSFGIPLNSMLLARKLNADFFELSRGEKEQILLQMLANYKDNNRGVSYASEISFLLNPNVVMSDAVLISHLLSKSWLSKKEFVPLFLPMESSNFNKRDSCRLDVFHDLNNIVQYYANVYLPPAINIFGTEFCHSQAETSGGLFDMIPDFDINLVGMMQKINASLIENTRAPIAPSQTCNALQTCINMLESSVLPLSIHIRQTIATFLPKYAEFTEHIVSFCENLVGRIVHYWELNSFNPSHKRADNLKRQFANALLLNRNSEKTVAQQNFYNILLK